MTSAEDGQGGHGRVIYEMGAGLAAHIRSGHEHLARSLSSSAGGGLVEGQPLPSAFALFLVQVVVIILVSRLMTYLLRPLKQPAVVGEMLSGIILGPTVLGRIPHFSDTLFTPASVSIMQVISTFGLCFFMFLVGLELDPAKIKRDLKRSMVMSACGLSLASICAFCLAIYFMQDAYSNTNYGTLGLFLTCSMGISALPVLARILSEKRMLNTRLGGLCMTTAALDDVVAWCLLAVVIAVVRAKAQVDIVYVFLLTAVNLVVVFGPVRKFINIIVQRSNAFTHLSADTFLILALILIIVCWFTEVIGLSALIGAFEMGLIIPRNSSLSHALSEKIEYFVVSMIMPLYFCNSGLRTQFGLIDDGQSVGIAVLLIIIATLAKTIGVGVPCMVMGVPWRISTVVGVLMSCKGLIALIVVNFGYDYHIITPKFFAILILMVMITTMQTVPLVNLVDPPSRARLSAQEMQQWEEADAARIAAKEAAKAAKAQEKAAARSDPTTSAKGTDTDPSLLAADAADPNDANGVVTSSADGSSVVLLVGGENATVGNRNSLEFGAGSTTSAHMQHVLASMSMRNLNFSGPAAAHPGVSDVCAATVDGRSRTSTMSEVPANQHSIGRMRSSRFASSSATTTPALAGLHGQSLTVEDLTQAQESLAASQMQPKAQPQQPYVSQAFHRTLSSMAVTMLAAAGAGGLEAVHDVDEHGNVRPDALSADSSLMHTLRTDSNQEHTKQDQALATPGSNSRLMSGRFRTQSGRAASSFDGAENVPSDDELQALLGGDQGELVDSLPASAAAPAARAAALPPPPPITSHTQSLPTVTEADESMEATLTATSAPGIAAAARMIAAQALLDNESTPVVREEADESVDRDDEGDVTLSLRSENAEAEQTAATGIVDSSGASFAIVASELLEPAAGAVPAQPDGTEPGAAGGMLSADGSVAEDGGATNPNASSITGLVLRLTRGLSMNLGNKSQAATPSHAQAPAAVAAQPADDDASSEITDAGDAAELQVAVNVGPTGEAISRTVSANARSSALSMDGQEMVPARQVQASVPPAAIQPLEVVMAVTDTQYASGLVAVANLFPVVESSSVLGSHSAALSSSRVAGSGLASKLHLLWLQEDRDMPSSYMNPALTVQELRDGALVAAMGRARACYSGFSGAVSVSVYPTNRAPWTDAVEEAIKSNCDFLLVSDHMISSQLSPVQSIMSGALGAALGLGQGGGIVSGIGAMISSVFGSSKAAAASDVAGQELTAVNAGMTSPDVGANDATIVPVPQTLPGPGSTMVEATSILKHVLSRPLPCSVAILFDYGSDPGSLSSASSAIGGRTGPSVSVLPLHALGGHANASGSALYHIGTGRHAILCPFDESSRSAEPALALLRRTAPEDVEVHLLRVSAGAAAAPAQSKRVAEPGIQGRSRSGSSASSTAGSAMGEVQATDAATGAPGSPTDGISRSSSINGGKQRPLSTPRNTLAAAAASLGSSVRLRGRSNSNAEAAAPAPSTPPLGSTSGPARMQPLPMAMLLPMANGATQQDGTAGADGAAPYGAESTIATATHVVQRSAQSLVPSAISGRGGIKVLSSRAASAVEAVDRLLKAQPGAYPLIVLGAQPDYTRMVDFGSDVEHDPAADGPSEGANHTRVASSADQQGHGHQVAVPIHPDVAVEEAVRSAASILAVAAAARVSVLVVVGHSITASAADDEYD